MVRVLGLPRHLFFSAFESVLVTSAGDTSSSSLMTISSQRTGRASGPQVGVYGCIYANECPVLLDGQKHVQLPATRYAQGSPLVLSLAPFRLVLVISLPRMSTPKTRRRTCPARLSCGHVVRLARRSRGPLRDGSRRRAVTVRMAIPNQRCNAFVLDKESHVFLATGRKNKAPHTFSSARANITKP